MVGVPHRPLLSSLPTHVCYLVDASRSISHSLSVSLSLSLSPPRTHTHTQSSFSLTAKEERTAGGAKPPPFQENSHEKVSLYFSLFLSTLELSVVQVFEP